MSKVWDTINLLALPIADSCHRSSFPNSLWLISVRQYIIRNLCEVNQWWFRPFLFTIPTQWFRVASISFLMYLAMSKLGSLFRIPSHFNSISDFTLLAYFLQVLLLAIQVDVNSHFKELLLNVSSYWSLILTWIVCQSITKLFSFMAIHWLSILKQLGINSILIVLDLMLISSQLAIIHVSFRPILGC